MFNYDPYSSEAVANPYPLYKNLRDEHPCYFVERHNSWVLSRFQDIWDAHLDRENLTATRGTQPWEVMAEKHWPSPMLHHYDYPQHQQLSPVLVEKFFGGAAINAHQEVIEMWADELVDAACEKGRFDMVHDVAWPLAARVTALVCGTPVEDAQWIKEQMELFQHREPGAGGITPVGQKAIGDVMQYLADHAKERRADGFDGESLADTIARTCVDGQRLGEGDDQAMATQMAMFMLGGSAQFPKIFSAMIYRLYKNPEQRAEVANNRSLIAHAFAEAMRIDNPTNMMGRIVTKAHKYHGQMLEPGQGILFLYASAGRDEREFDDPDTFSIHRRPERTLSFGVGHHKCIGRGYGMREADILASRVLARMPEYVLDDANMQMLETEYMRGWLTVPTSVV